MKNRTLTATLLASAIALGLAAPAGAQDTPRSAEQTLEDATITAAVKTALLADPLTDGLAMDVDTSRGVVTLNGIADSAAERAAAAEHAFEVSGVVGVANRITVSASTTATVATPPPASPPPRESFVDLDGDGVDEVGPGPDADVDNFQDLDNDGVDEVGPGPDAELNNVSDLDNDGVDEVGPGPDAKTDNFVDLDNDGVDEVGPGPDANVDNFQDLDNDGVDEVGPGPDAELDNVADLDGDGVDEVGPGPDAKVADYDSGSANATAGATVSADPTPNTLKDTDGDGVDEVDDPNDLVGDKVDDDRLGDGTGGPSDALDDAWITSKVKTQLLADEAVDGVGIDVDTQANIVTLTGTVRTLAEREAAIRIAAATQGVLKVIADALTIRAR